MSDDHHRITVPPALRRRGTASFAIAVILAALGLVASVSAMSSAPCPICGKNLIKNPGAEAGRGQDAEDESGAVPGWTKKAGAFGAAAYSYGGFWFGPTDVGPKDRGKNYFFGGSLGGSSFPQSVGTQTIALPAAASGRKATLSGWLGNYGSDTAQVRAQFTDASGKVLTVVRIGPDTTIGGSNMGFRIRSATVPAGTTSVTIVVTFTDHHNASEAGADDLSLTLA